MKLPSELGPIHFVGIGGIGMSGIAEVLHNLGYRVQGSDASDNANVKRLRDKGIAIFIGGRSGDRDGDHEAIDHQQPERQKPAPAGPCIDEDSNETDDQATEAEDEIAGADEAEAYERHQNVGADEAESDGAGDETLIGGAVLFHVAAM